MMIEKIKVSNFRNLGSRIFNFSDNTTVIIGPNASGKTNIFESLYLLSTGKSFRAKVQEEMISYDEEVGRVKGRISQKKSNEGKESKDHTDLEITLTRGEITVGESPKRTEKAPRKRLKVNGVVRRLIDFSGNFKVTLFAPWHLDLVTESPSGRRDFLDSVLSQIDREYRRAILSYSKGLRQRNKLLLRIREEGLSRSQLLFWNKLLIKNGNYISEKRGEFINYANGTEGFDHHEFSLEYDKSAISEGRLEQYAKEEVAAATTLVGPHRDDMQFSISNSQFSRAKRDLARYGSRGEQRMGVLWLKLAELSYIEEMSGEKPTLLLDDIFSELDHEHREIVFGISKNQQTIITTADEHSIEGLKRVEKVELG